MLIKLIYERNFIAIVNYIYEYLNDSKMIDKILKIVELQKKINEEGLALNLIHLYSRYYDIHKARFGSLKKYIWTDQYNDKCKGRWDYIIGNINNDIEKMRELYR